MGLRVDLVRTTRAVSVGHLHIQTKDKHVFSHRPLLKHLNEYLITILPAHPSELVLGPLCKLRWLGAGLGAANLNCGREGVKSIAWQTRRIKPALTGNHDLDWPAQLSIKAEGNC